LLEKLCQAPKPLRQYLLKQALQPVQVLMDLGVEVVVEELPDSVIIPNPKQLRQEVKVWGVSDDAGFDMCGDNLKNKGLLAPYFLFRCLLT
jgi:hypothetical protein